MRTAVRRSAAVIGVLVLPMWLTMLGAAKPVAANVPPVPPPPLPTVQCDQAGTMPCAGAVPVKPCTAPPPGQPNTWQEVTSVTQTGPNSATASSGAIEFHYQFLPDPSTPCLIYRVDGSGQRIDRSVDFGATWHAVLYDNAPRVTGSGTFHVSVIRPLGPGAVIVGEDSVGDGVLVSRDAGSSWHLANGPADAVSSGLRGEGVSDIAVAGDGATVYAATPMAGGTGARFVPLSGVYISGDGGETWVPGPNSLPASPGANAGSYSGMAHVLVDPLQAGIAYYNYFDPSNALGGNVIYASTDHGATWTKRPAPGTSTTTPSTNIYAMVTAHSDASRPGKVYVVSDTSSVSDHEYVYSSADAGQSWTQENKIGIVITLAVDPLNADLGMYVAQPHAAPYVNVPYPAALSYDSFVTQALAQQTPVAVSDSGDIPGVAATDLQHNLYFEFDHANPQAGSHSRSLYRYTPPPPGTLQAVGIGTQGNGTCSGCHAPSAANVFSCTPSGTGGSATPDVAFDGHYLYVTQSGDTTAAPGHAVIYRVDPTTCSAVGGATAARIDVAFDSSAANAGRGFNAAAPAFAELTYDPNHDVLLAQTPLDQNNDPPAVFAMPLPSRSSQNVSTTASLRYVSTCYRQSYQQVADVEDRLFAYDATDNSIWGCAYALPDHLSATDGKQLSHCFGAIFNPNDNQTGTTNDAWGTAGPGFLNIFYAGFYHHVDMRTCDSAVAFQPVPGPGGPNDQPHGQIVCDPLSFATGVPGLPAAIAAPGSVIWMRPASSGKLEAFDLGTGANSSCPLPTALQFLGPSTVSRVSTAPVCLSAKLSLLGEGDGVGGQSVQFTVDGAAVGSSAVTAGTGSGKGIASIAQPGCFAASALSTGVHTVSLSFGGSSGLLPTALSATFGVTDLPAPVQRGQPNAPQPPPAPPPAPVPAVIPVPAPEPVAPAPQAPVSAPAPAQVTTQQLVQGQGAAAAEREEEPEVAFAYAASDDAAPENAPAAPSESPPDQYSMSAVSTDGTSASEAALGTLATLAGIALVAGVARRYASRSTPAPMRALAVRTETAARRRRRRR